MTAELKRSLRCYNKVEESPRTKEQREDKNWRQEMKNKGPIKDVPHQDVRVPER